MSDQSTSTSASSAPERPASRLPGRWIGLAVGAALLTAVGITGGLIWSGTQGSGTAATSRLYAATGKIISFGPSRDSVTIAHERIEGFMEAMTMPFEFADAKQAPGLRDGDRVHFSFTATSDGRLVISTITADGR